MLYLIPIFLSAFLIFQVQPILAKVLLPYFGGGASVWTACLLFFQSVLFLGYLYAHWLSKLKALKLQLAIHFALLVVAAIFLPVEKPQLTIALGSSPQWDIVLLLAQHIGLPYFVLSASSTLIQRWHSLLSKEKSSYQLYAISNAGSLLALLSYPFVIEPLLTLQWQGQLWSAGFICLILAFAILFKHLLANKTQISDMLAQEQADGSSIKLSLLVLWLMLAATGVMSLIATTNAMTQNVPPVPFLWILPLCIYLASYIICFQAKHWYIRWFWLCCIALAGLAAIIMHIIGSQFDLLSQVLIYSFILFSTCMVCHGELAILQPKYQYLSRYYLMIAAGGFTGSLLVSIGAEQLFTDFIEFPIVTMLALLLVIIIMNTKAVDKANTTLVIKLAAAAVFIVQIGLLYTSQVRLSEFDIAKHRNFFGILKVVDIDIDNETERRLIDGTTSHGTQSLSEPTIAKSYYRANTGVAIALEKLIPVGLSKEPKNVGIIGLGAGTLAAYGNPLEYYHFYEINPTVKQFAEQHFSYLANSQANIDISLGDGRNLLKDELATYGSQQYDVLVVDAFSGDAIPMHLLTLEAFQLYWQHLKADGILALHISNSHLDLKALTRSLSQAVNKQAYYFHTAPAGTESNAAEWVLVTNNEQFINAYAVRKHITDWPESSNKTLIWTDDYSNLLSVIK